MYKTFKHCNSCIYSVEGLSGEGRECRYKSCIAFPRLITKFCSSNKTEDILINIEDYIEQLYYEE